MADDPKKQDPESADIAVDDEPVAAEQASDGGPSTQTIDPSGDSDAEETSPGANDADGDESGEPPPQIPPRELQRIQRKRQLLIAVGLTAIFVVIVVWASLNPRSREKPLGIAPSVLFERQCLELLKNRDSETLHVDEFEVTDQMIAQVTNLDFIETLIIDQGVLTDAAIVPISALPNLRHLRLRLSPITDEGLKTLAQCESLWYVNLPHAECTAEGVAALSQLPRLRQLRLGSPDLGNEVTDAIASIETLRGIHLIGVAVTDEGLKKLAGMPHLESLYLDDAKVTEAGWDWLFKFHPQLHVHINQAHHDRDPHRHAHHNR